MKSNEKKPAYKESKPLATKKKKKKIGQWGMRKSKWKIKNTLRKYNIVKYYSFQSYDTFFFSPEFLNEDKKRKVKLIFLAFYSNHPKIRSYFTATLLTLFDKYKHIYL